MNKLTETELFTETEKRKKIFSSKMKEIIINLHKYIIPESLIKLFKNEIANYRFKFSEQTHELLDNGSIIPIISEDPVDKNDNMIQLPYMIQMFNIKTNNDNKVIVNLSLKAKYDRDRNPEKSINGLRIATKDFYGYMESATILYLLNENEDKLKRATKLNEKLVELFSQILAKAIDRNIGFSAVTENYDYPILFYICGRYFSMTHLGLDGEMAHKLTTNSLKRIDDKNIIQDNLLNFKTEEQLNINNISKLIELMISQFSVVKTSNFDLKTLFGMYRLTVGDNGFFSLEHFFSFIFLLMGTLRKLKIFNEKSLNRLITTKDFTDLEKLLFDSIGR